MVKSEINFHSLSTVEANLKGTANIEQVIHVNTKQIFFGEVFISVTIHCNICKRCNFLLYFAKVMIIIIIIAIRKY